MSTTPLATPSVGSAPRRPATWREKLDGQFWKLALAPTLIVLLALTVYPAVQLLVMGFSTVTFAEKDGRTLVTYSEVYPTSQALDASLGGMEGAPEQFEQLAELLTTLGHPAHPKR